MKKFILKVAPFLSHWLQYLKAWRDVIMPIRSYSQYKEDLRVKEILKSYNWQYDGIYIDVGANHPTVLSNTYHFYRKGHRGILFEPNKFFYNLNCRFRKKDTVIQIGISNEPKLLQFNYTASHVLNTFADVSEEKIIKRTHLPILPLDLVMRDLKMQGTPVFLLSIDVEGLDYEVLEGARETLKNTMLVCIEANTPESEKKIHKFMEATGFELKDKIEVNLFYINPEKLKKD